MVVGIKRPSEYDFGNSIALANEIIPDLNGLKWNEAMDYYDELSAYYLERKVGNNGFEQTEEAKNITQARAYLMSAAVVKRDADITETEYRKKLSEAIRENKKLSAQVTRYEEEGLGGLTEPWMEFAYHLYKRNKRLHPGAKPETIWRHTLDHFELINSLNYELQGIGRGADGRPDYALPLEASVRETKTQWKKIKTDDLYKEAPKLGVETLQPTLSEYTISPENVMDDPFGKLKGTEKE